ncbi:MAG: sulfatase [Mariniblastus sp.]|nr:sulfatase [Mariniblastus sp.]
MSRYLIFTALASVCLAMQVSSSHVLADQPVAPTSHEEKMNLIVIMTDEHNFRTLGCYRKTMEGRQAYMWGPDVVETPHIDSLAEQGALCSSFYATTPVCSPSRACLISGLYPQKTPVVKNNIPLNDDIVSFAEILGQQGYATGFAGKWHLDGTAKPGWEPKRKFGFADNRYMFNRGHWKKLDLTKTGAKVAARKNGGPSYDVDGADEQTFTTDFLIDRLIDFVDKNRSQPFCYMVSLPDPHGPDTVRQPYDSMYQEHQYLKPTTFDKPDEGLPSWGQKQKSGFGMASYYGMVKCIDDNIGRLIEHLDKAGILDQTVIVFTADHGDLRGEHHRQNKGVPYEGSTRVPFLVRFPGKIKPGTRVDQALTSIDFAPTILPMMGIQTDREFDGRNASALFQSEPADPWQDISIVRGTGDKQGWLMAVTDRYKLVVSATDPPWLFDLQRDPDEVVNLFSHPGYREIARQLATSLREYGEQHQDPFIRPAKVDADLTWAIRGSGEYPGR